jgi:hypothetical protein
MSTMEHESSVSSRGGAGFTSAAGMAKTLQPKKLNLKKASVDDLRRLYEERASTAEALGRAEREKRVGRSGSEI